MRFSFLLLLSLLLYALLVGCAPGPRATPLGASAPEGRVTGATIADAGADAEPELRPLSARDHALLDRIESYYAAALPFVADLSLEWLGRNYEAHVWFERPGHFRAKGASYDVIVDGRSLTYAYLPDGIVSQHPVASDFVPAALVFAAGSLRERFDVSIAFPPSGEALVTLIPRAQRHPFYTYRLLASPETGEVHEVRVTDTAEHDVHERQTMTLTAFTPNARIAPGTFVTHKREPRGIVMKPPPRVPPIVEEAVPAIQRSRIGDGQDAGASSAKSASITRGT
jgi:hypothetical protein